MSAHAAPTAFASSSLALLQAMPADTVVTVVARDGLETAATISIIVLGVFLLVLLLVLLVLLVQLSKLHKTLKGLGEKALLKADPLVERGKGAMDNVEFVSSVIRQDVERVSGTVRSLNERLHEASDRMEVRIEEFNALMEVVQGEAEDIFLGTASTARGVKEGVRALGEESETRPPLRRPERLEPRRLPHDETEVLLTGDEGEA